MVIVAVWTRQSVRHASGDKHCIAPRFCLARRLDVFTPEGNDDRRLRRNKPYRALGLAERKRQ